MREMPIASVVRRMASSSFPSDPRSPAAPHSRRASFSSRHAIAATAIPALLLLLCVFTAPGNHDESQYVAGAALARSGLIYRDYASLQPPLQSWVYAPLAMLFPGWTLLAMRVATALLGAAIASATYRAQRILGIAPRIACLATLLMASCAAYQFTGSVVRNDAMPAALSAWAMVALLSGITNGRLRPIAIAGLLLGAAVGAKLSYAPVLACVSLVLVVQSRRTGFGRPALFAAGALLGLMPMLAAWAAAPDAFVYGVLTYARTAPFDWYAASGRARELGIGFKLLTLTTDALLGPVLLAAVVAAALGFRRWECGRAEHWVLASFVVGGAIGAVLPTPAQLQYLLPVLPPLFLALGMAMARMRPGSPIARGGAWGMTLFAVAGTIPTLLDTLNTLASGSPVLQIERRAHWIGNCLRGIGTTGMIATLSPDRAIDSHYPIDPRFSAGPFLFRNGRLMSPELATSVKAVTPQTMGRAFAMDPPAAILVGYEQPGRNGSPPADAPLEAYAQRHHFVAARVPDGIGRLYVRPSRPAGRTASKSNVDLPPIGR